MLYIFDLEVSVLGQQFFQHGKAIVLTTMQKLAGIFQNKFKSKCELYTRHIKIIIFAPTLEKNFD